MTRRLHQVPIHITTPEAVVSVGPLTLTARQFLLCLLGCALSYNLWQHLALLTAPLELVARFVLATIPALVAGVFALLRLADRPLEQWGLVVVRFSLQPRLLLWRSLRHDPDHVSLFLSGDSPEHGPAHV